VCALQLNSLKTERVSSESASSDLNVFASAFNFVVSSYNYR
jgi:hypothetical protein